MLNIDQASTLLLVDIGEIGNNNLRLVVLEASPTSDTEMTVLGPATAMRPDQSSEAFELVWYGYVAFNVCNESYAGSEERETKKLGRLATHTNSAYLRYLAASTLASDDYPGKLVHWSINTEWHCVDVVSVEPPEIRKLTASEVARYLEDAV